MNKTRQRRRTSRIFIESAAEIIREEGIDALTIRKVADIAAYNSATLYNYFENLDHLKSLSALIFIKDYTDNLDEEIKDCANAYEINEKIWLFFYRHTYRKPDIFYSIFGKSVNKAHNSYINDFYDIFPEHLSVQSDKVRGMIVEENLFDRTMFLLKQCAAEDYFAYEDLEEIYELIFFIYQGMLNKLLACPTCMTEDEFVEKAKAYNNRIFDTYKKRPN